MGNVSQYVKTNGSRLILHLTVYDLETLCICGTTFNKLLPPKKKL